MPNYIVSFEEDAKIDIADSYDRYNNISKKVAEKFISDLKKVTNYLEENPLLFKIAYKDFRQVPLKKYPFILLYKISDKQVKIYRVFATKQNPKNVFS